MLLLLSNFRQRIQLPALDVPWDAPANEYNHLYTVKGRHVCPADVASGRCSNAICPLGILRTPTGNREPAPTSAVSSPDAETYRAPKLSHPASLFLPPRALADVPEADLARDVAPEAIKSASAAPEPLSSCNTSSFCPGQHLFTQAVPASLASSRISKTCNSPPAAWNSPFSTGRLLMVDWTSPASFPTKSACREESLPVSPAKKRHRTEETIPRLAAFTPTASVYAQETTSPAAWEDPLKNDAIVRLSQATLNLQPSSGSCITSFEDKPLLPSGNASRTVHQNVGGVLTPGTGLTQSTCFPSRTCSSSSETGQQPRVTVAQCVTVPRTFTNDPFTLKISRCTTVPAGVEFPRGSNSTADQLYAAAETPNFSCGINSGATYPKHSMRAAIRLKENKRSPQLLHNQTGTENLPSSRATHTLFPSSFDASNVNATVLSKHGHSQLIRDLQTSKSDTSRNSQRELLHDVPIRQDERLPGTRVPSATPAELQTDETKPVMPTTLAHVEAPPAEADMSTFLSLLLWPCNVGPYHFHPAILKAIYAGWTRLRRSRGPARRQQPTVSSQ